MVVLVSVLQPSDDPPHHTHTALVQAMPKDVVLESGAGYGPGHGSHLANEVDVTG